MLTAPMEKKQRMFRKGFSLGEVMLSIAVLSVGILPVVSTISHSFQISVEDQRIIIASGLAQEGVELTQNVRDNSALHGTDAFTGWLPAVGSVWNDCRIDFGDPVVTDPVSNRISCSNSGTASYDLTTASSGPYKGLYLHQDVAGFYKRRMFLSYSSAAKELSVVSAVYWGSFVPQSANQVESTCNMANRCVFAETTLTAWR